MTSLIPTSLRHQLRRTRFWALSMSATLLFGIGIAAPSTALADSASWSAQPASASWSGLPASASWSVLPASASWSGLPAPGSTSD